MGAVNADISFTSVSGDTQTVLRGTTATVSFKLTEDGTGGATNINFNTPITLTSGTNTIVSDATVVNAINVLTVNTTSATMSLNFSIPSTQARGTYTGTLAPSATYTGTFNPLSITLTIENPLEIQSCTDIGNPGDLRVKSIDFKNDGMNGKEFGDDNEWFPLDDVEVEIEIENNGNEDVDDVEVEWGIYNTQSNEWVMDLEDEKDFNLKDGKDEILTVSFNIEDDFDVDIDELDDGDHYRFYVTARGTVDNQASDDTCVTDYETAEIIIESDFVVLDNIEYPETVMCGETVQVSADVWNIGDNDQDEVSVFVLGKDLDLRKDIMVGDIDAFDNDKIDFTFEVPSNIEAKTYTLIFEVYDEDGDIYENDFDEDESEFFLPFRVEDCKGVFDGDEVSVSASLQSGGKAGEDLVVRATITNNGDELETFTVNAAGFTQWASSYTSDRSTLVLDEGESADVLFTFDVNKDASGSQSFTIELVSSENQITTQPVSVAIEERSGLFGLTGEAISGNAYLWGIGLLNIILVVIIIIVAVRVARR
jgi:uncharacterized membrane protein